MPDYHTSYANLCQIIKMLKLKCILKYIYILKVKLDSRV